MRFVFHWLRRALGRLLAWPFALIIVFEEWGWEPLQRALARLTQQLHLARLEAWVRGLPPYAALALFLLPSLALLPVKLAALTLIARGHALLGAAVIVAAKLAGTAIVARLFTLTQPALMQLAWFATLYVRWTGWKQVWLDRVRASWPWRWARVVKRRTARWWRGSRSPGTGPD